MKIYRIGMYSNPTADSIGKITSVTFAHFSVVGTWVYEREPCAVCGWHWQTIVPPLRVQWERSTTVIGDFSWDGPFGYAFTVKDSVAEALRNMDFTCDFRPVEYVPPETIRDTVAFPYDGPNLSLVDCSVAVDLDMSASNVRLESSCAACGDVRYTFRKKGIVIRRSNWPGYRIFRIRTNGRSDATFVSAEGRQMIEAAGFSNVSFTEAGDIVD